MALGEVPVKAEAVMSLGIQCLGPGTPVCCRLWLCVCESASVQKPPNITSQVRAHTDGGSVAHTLEQCCGPDTNTHANSCGMWHVARLLLLSQIFG